MPITISSSVKLFIEYCQNVKTLSPHTLRAYENDLHHAERTFGAFTDIKYVDRNQLREYIGQMINKQNLKYSTIKRRLATIKQLFKWLENEGVVDISPFYRLEVSIRIPHRLPRNLSTDEMRKILLYLDDSVSQTNTYSALLMNFVVVLLVVTGIRIGEFIGICLQDINEEDNSILIHGKGNRERKVYIAGQQAKTILSEFLKLRKKITTTSDSLLILEHGGTMTAQYIRRHLKAITSHIGLKRNITPHMLRHTAATQLVESGVDIRFVQKLLGHASIATTQIYTQVSDASLMQSLEKADTLKKITAYD